MITGRYYQVESVEAVWEYLHQKDSSQVGNPLVVLPTGTGKSVCIALLIERLLTAYPRLRILVVTHVKELIQQNYDKLIAVWPTAPAGIYSAGLGRKDLMMQVTFGGIASVAKSMGKLGVFDIVIVDEAHLISPNDATMYGKVFAFLRQSQPFLKVAGFTATDFRLGQGKLTTGENALFTDVVCDYSSTEQFNRLVAEGYLAPLVPRKMTTYLDVSGVHMRGGEFIEKELQEAVNKDSITRAAIEEAIAYKDSRRCWLVFASGTDHSDRVAELLNEYGISAVSIHSKMKGNRTQALADVRAGKYQAVVNNNILTTGFDLPPIDLIMVLRPTGSPGLWVQMLGRGTRPYDPINPGGIDPAVFPLFKRDCLVLDYARNTRKLGPINDPVIPRPKGKGGGEAPIKECPNCGNYCHASVRWCGGVPVGDPKFIRAMGCGYEFDFALKLNANAGTDDIIKGDLPVVECFKVSHISYERYSKMDRPDSVRVNYYCGISKKFTEYVCIEHPMHQGGFRAKRWVKERVWEGQDKPETTEDLLLVAPNLKQPTHIRVWTNKKYPEIMAVCFDGTAFGEETSSGDAPTVDSAVTPAQTESYLDDDIPF